jgi:Tat protein translocase TatB subunit
MNVFGIGTMEIMVLMVAALIIFGPGKLPEVAGQVGRAVRDFRRMTSDLTGEFEKTMAEADDIKRSFNEGVSGMRSQVTSVSDSVKKDLAKSTAKGTTAKATTAKSTMAKTAASGTSATRAKSASGKTTTGSTATTTAKPALPKATKANPLGGISLLEDAPRKSPDPIVAGEDDDSWDVDPEAIQPPAIEKASKPQSGSQAGSEPTVSDAVMRARQRRTEAGYNRRAR